MTSNRLLEKIIANWPVKIISVAVAVVLFLFYRIGSLEQRFFSIPLAAVASENFVVTEKSSQSIRVKLRGTQDEVFLVYEEDVEAYIDLTDHRSEGQFRAPVLLRKKGTAENVEVEFKIEPIDVTVTLEEKVFATLDVVTEIRGNPATGYELAEFTLQPSAVEIGGPRSRIETIQNVNTEIVDISGRDSDFSLRIPIKSPGPDVELVTDKVVEFTGVIKQVIITRTFEAVEVVSVNLDERFGVPELPEVGSIRTRGAQLLLETIRPEQLKLVIDGADISDEGLYTLVVVPQIPTGLQVMSYEPVQIEVEVEARAAAENAGEQDSEATLP